MKHDVVVVGGGVTGAATALAFLRHGFAVALVDRGAPPVAAAPEAYDARVYALSPGSVRFLEALGVWPRIAARRVSPYERMQVWETDPAQSLVFDAAELAVPELGFIVEDVLLREALWAALGSAALHTGAQVSAYDAAAQRLKLASGDVLEAPLIVSAEGAESRLREAAGIELVGWTYAQRSLVCHVGTARPHRRTAYQRFLPGGPLAFLPLADGRSSIVWSTSDREVDALLALDDAAFRSRLGETFDALGAITSATPRLAFPLRLLHAEEYVRPGLALVGDSAHVVHPLAGQGLNLGLADAQALVEVVAAARGRRKAIGNLRVLRQYERRRKAGNIEALVLTDGLHRLFGVRNRGLEGIRELGMNLVSRAGPLKRMLAERAMGIY